MYSIFEHFPKYAREYALKFDYGAFVNAVGNIYILDEEEFDPLGRCLLAMGFPVSGAPTGLLVSHYLEKDVTQAANDFIDDWDSSKINDLKAAMGLRH